MTEKDDLRARLYELHVGTDEHHATARQIRVMILDGDLVGAADALDALELDIHTALAAGSGPGGSGLPEQWTDGGNGNVTATTDDPSKVPLTINPAPGAADAGTDTVVIGYDDTGFAPSNNGQPFMEINNYSVHLSSPSGVGVVDFFESDGNGSIGFDPTFGLDVTLGANNAGGLQVGWASGVTPSVNNGLLLGAQGKVGGVDGKIGDVKITSGGYLVIARNSAPDDASLSAGDLALWFDQTDGAAKLMLRGKSANGTVVTGQVALS